jgi:(E)-4-hydroxy-3-methylbut-2-enyl-diphosphate synthase
MTDEFNECYPLHLGVTEAGDGEDGRIKSAVGIGTLLEDGIGDTIRVSLTEDPEFEIPVCKDIVSRYSSSPSTITNNPDQALPVLPYNPFAYSRRESFAVGNIGGGQVPVVVADLSSADKIEPASLKSIGYTYDDITDKWSIGDAAADYIYAGVHPIQFALPGTVKVIVPADAWARTADTSVHYPIFSLSEFSAATHKSNKLNFVMVDCKAGAQPETDDIRLLGEDTTVVICLSSTDKNAMQSVRSMFGTLMELGCRNPVILITDSSAQTTDEHLIHFATETGALLLDGLGDGICLGYTSGSLLRNLQTTGRTYLPVNDIYQFTNNTAFSILQATRTRISKTEYISCPSCGRTLFDLQETTSKIRARTNHLKGVKIAVMGCIVNGPGEMADADFGYVGSGPGKITLYKGKEVMKKNVNSEVAVEELINLIKSSNAWIDN